MQTATLRAAPVAPQFEIGFAAIGTAIRRWTAASRTRNALSALPDRQLADLGIHRSEIDRIAREAAQAI